MEEVNRNNFPVSLNGTHRCLPPIGVSSPTGPEGSRNQSWNRKKDDTTMVALKSSIKKIVALGVGVIFIIALCVVMMYVL